MNLCYSEHMARKGRRSTNEERIEAIRLLQQGYTRAEVASILRVAESSVYDWQDKFRKGGLAALSTKIASGRKRLLTNTTDLSSSGPDAAVTWRVVLAWR